MNLQNVFMFFSSSFMLTMSLVMISENVKLAREYALLGNYDSAMVYYQGVLDQMSKYLSSVKDTYLQQKWQQVSFHFLVLFLYFHVLNRIIISIRPHFKS